MSVFDFINESQRSSSSSSSRASKKNAPNRKNKTVNIAGLASNQFFDEESSESRFDNYSNQRSSLFLSNKGTASANRSTPPQSSFKSSFSFINQNNGNQSVSNQAKHQPLKFSSSFIMEDFVDDDDEDDEIDYQPNNKNEKYMKNENINNYFSLMEEFPGTFVEKKRNVSTSKGTKGKLSQSMSDNITSSRHDEGESPMTKSAFGFINQDPSTLNRSTTIEEIEPPPVMPKSIIKPDKETQLLLASTRWQKIQKQKVDQIQRIERHYDNQIKCQKTMHEIESRIKAIEYKKQQALESEDFEAAHQHAISKQKTEKEYSELLSRNVTDQVRKEWQRLISVLQQESKDAENMVECCQVVKEERQRRMARFASDKERLHGETVKQMEQQRATIESEKSEIAFDLGMWNQNHADLDERMEDAVQDQVKRKKTLESTSATIQLNIEELRQKLKQLESEQATVNQELKDVEIAINSKLSVFAEEVTEYDAEKKTIESRQEEIQHKALLLDEQDAKIEKDMESKKATQQLNEKELDQLTENMDKATERAQASNAEQEILGNVLKVMIETRDQTAAHYKEAIRESRASVSKKKQEIKSYQDKLYQCEQACIDLEEDTAKATSKLKSLDKLKGLAIENGQFEKAGALSIKIKAAQSALSKLKETSAPQEEISLINEQLATANDQLDTLEQDLALIQNEKKTELGQVLEKLNKTLDAKLRDESLEEYDTLMAIVKLELKSIEAQLSDIQTVL